MPVDSKQAVLHTMYCMPVPEGDLPNPEAEHRGSPKKALLTEPELKLMLTDSLTALSEELAHGKSERLLTYLEFASRFPHYSRANQSLILLQNPDATRVASYKKWQEEGYQVAKGQTGIRILAPRFQKVQDETTGEETHAVIGFFPVSVFDVSQLTEEKRPPQFFTPLEGNADALYDRVRAAATQDGFVVEESPHTRGAEGYSQSRCLVTRVGLASTNRVLTLLHEYTHGLLHQGISELSEQRELSTSLQECHAEASAYVVAQHFKLPTPFSTDYLLQWGTTPEKLRAELDSVIKAASHIITAVHAQLPGEEGFHDQPDETTASDIPIVE